MTVTPADVETLESFAAQLDEEAGVLRLRNTLAPEYTKWTGFLGTEATHDAMKANVEKLYDLASKARAELGMPPL